MPDLPLFISALAVAYLVPGPDMILVLQTAAAQGRRSALSAAAGLAIARGLHVVLSGAGLAALVSTSDAAFEAVRWIGAAYLVWLGLSIFRARSLAPETGDPAAFTGSDLAAFRKGLLTNLLNPKALLFCSVLLPQFVDPSVGSMGLQFGLLGAVVVLTGAAFDVAFAIAGARIGAFVSGHKLVEQAERWLFGSLLIGFGLRLALLQR
ncbi:LysE family translocator [Chthonobacter albigriseus]|uniref:LysE family translocator n=1 Tax=Chthonobacter albigriseus TaxID=1683161 RepID=UPI0015EEF310|nr:LysE family translocator [Chthonobacter albigriseus]